MRLGRGGRLFQRSFLAGVVSDDGFRLLPIGKNWVRLRRAGTSYYVFVEPLATTPPSFSMDTSAVWLDAGLTAALDDPELTAVVVERAKQGLIFAGYGVATD